MKNIYFNLKPLFFIAFFSFAQNNVSAISVTLDPDEIECEETQITGTFDCFFNGTITAVINGDPNNVTLSNLSNVTNGVFTFDLDATSNTDNNIQIDFEIITTDDPTGCSFPGQTTSANVSVDCSCGGDIFLTVIHESCFECEDGSVSVEAVDLTDPITYEWSTGDNGTEINDLAPDLYSVTVTDVDECQYVQIVIVDPYECEPLDIISSVQQESCFDFCDGEIEIMSLSDGSTDFGVEWSDGSDDFVLTDLCPGTYDVTVTASDNCQYFDQFIIAENTPLEYLVSNINHQKNDGPGSIESVATGGQPPYMFSIFLDGVMITTHDPASSTFVDLIPGCYDIMVTDANGCIATVNDVCIEDKSDPELELMLSDTLIFCDSTTINAMLDCNFNGMVEISLPKDSVNVEVSNVSPVVDGKFSFNVDANSQANDTLIIKITVTETDSTDCSFVGQMTVDTISIFCECQMGQVLISSMDETCLDMCDGSGLIEGLSDNTGIVSVMWSDSSSMRLREDLCPGTYSVSVLNVDLCVFSGAVQVNQGDTIFGIVDKVVDATPDQGGSISLSTVGGEPPYMYSLVDATGAVIQTTDIPEFLDLTSGCYQIIIEDKNGCIVIIEEVCVMETVSVFELAQNEFSIYPNPASDRLNIVNKNGHVMDLVQIFNLKGQLIHQSLPNQTIDVSHFIPGMYLIKISNEDAVWHSKIIIAN